MEKKILVSGFSDEIDKDIFKQFEHLKELRMSYFEPRGINGKNISMLTDEEVVDLKNLMEKYNIKASSIGSPIGKILITEDFNSHMEKLERVIHIAKELGTGYIRIFSFLMEKEEDYITYRDEVISRMKAMTKLAEECGVVLLHENEKDIYGDTANRCYELLTEVNSSHLRAVFDPANFVQCKEDTIKAFDLLKEHVIYMHIKDAKHDGSVVPAGAGEGNLKYILQGLKERGYEGFYSLEPHLQNFDGLAFLEQHTKNKSITEEKKTSSGADKFTLAYTEFMNLIKQI